MSIFSSIDAEHHREILKRLVTNLKRDDLDQEDYTLDEVSEILDTLVKRFDQECIE